MGVTLADVAGQPLSEVYTPAVRRWQDGSLVMTHTPALPGEETLLACWNALAQLSPGARLIRSPSGAPAAVFPVWAPLNNAILVDAEDTAARAAIAAELDLIYAGAGVETWALWMPSRTTDLDSPDEVRDVGKLTRDTTTLVMRASLPDEPRTQDRVLRTSIATATRASDEPVRVADLGAPDGPPGLSAWVLVRDGLAVAGAWSYLHDADCGIYAVGTSPQWRRKGLARTLMTQVLADARQQGARTATLQATRMGRQLYESLGFEAVGRYEEWVSS